MVVQSSNEDVGSKPRHVEIQPWVLYLGTLLQSSGAAMLWPITTLYMHQDLHESMTVAGVVLMAISIAMMLGGYLGGYLFDHWNPYRAVMTAVSVATVTLGLITIWHGWPLFAVLMLIIGFADGVLYTLLSAYASTIQAIDSRRVFNMNYMFMNVGVVIGTVVVGSLYNYGVAYVFGTAFAMYFVFAILAGFKFKVQGLALQAAKAAERAEQSHFKTPNLVYALLGLTFSIYFGYILWESVVATHMTDLGLTIQDYSSLWTINGVVLIIGQSILNRYADRIKFKTSVLGGGLLFASSFLFLITAKSYAAFLGAFMILTVGEMLASPQIPAWIAHISDPNAQGRAQGQVMMFTSFGRALGPLFGGFVIDAASYQTLFAIIFVIMIVFILISWLVSMQKN
ncbi:MFS transporter [Weissella diestrammenae]|uniref:MFS transporter n=1 Tax=Weissella diestrammenae TaxID=1162633 RepID=A0A7G9T6P5_9LACO|nr:MFS transporter [Weissella diestrammenae]MCM0582944.1 MFS transporter [Weissella diestrammenae]QNN75770.1 MFS transporter [Weissella diestrammenae]